MKRIFYLFSLCALFLGMGACSDDIFDNLQPENTLDLQTKAVSNETSTLAYILSEGDWYSKTMGTITKFNPSTQTVTPGYFKTVNGVELGDTGNEMVLYNGKIYCLVSGHDLTSNNGGLWIIDPATCQAMPDTMIQYNDPKLTGYKAMPRHMAFDNGKIYISLYSGAVISVNINEPQTVVGTKILPAKFSEGICVVNNVVYVCNSGKADDTMAGKGNTISYFATNAMDGTSKNVSTMTSALNPKLIKYSEKNGCFYYNALGEGAMNTSLHYFTNPNMGYETIANVKGSSFELTNDNIYSVDMNWKTYTTSMYKVNLSTNEGAALTISGIMPDSFFGYSIVYHNGLLYVGESMSDGLYVFEKDASFKYVVNTNVANINTVVFVN